MFFNKLLKTETTYYQSLHWLNQGSALEMLAHLKIKNLFHVDICQPSFFSYFIFCFSVRLKGRCIWIDLIMFGWLTCDAVTSSAHSSKCRGFLSMWRRWQLGKQKRGEIDLRTKLYNFVFKRVEYTLVNWHFLVFPPKLIWKTDLRLRGKTGLWRSCLDSLFASITQADWGETYLNTAEKLRLIYLQCLL